MTKRSVTNPTAEDKAEALADVDFPVLIHTSTTLNLRVGRELEGHLIISGKDDQDNGLYLEVEDATLLLRFPDGTPFMRLAVVNGFLTGSWVIVSVEDLEEMAERLGVGIEEEE